MFSRVLLFIATLLAITVDVISGASLRGVVLDIESRRPISAATVRLLGRDVTRVSDSVGAFRFDELPDSTYRLHVSHIAYKDNTIDLALTLETERAYAIYLFPKTLEVAPVVVMGEHDHSRFERLTETATVLAGPDLQKEIGATIAATLKNETGLAMRAMGPAPARPVIRGLGGDRVLIAEDGAKTVDLSATSPDHAVTIEPFAAEQIAVVRGPRTLLQTPTTIGGVVNVVRHEVPDVHHDQGYLTVGAYGETANDGALGSALFDLPLHPLALRGEINRRSARDLETPVGRLNNSDSRTTDYSIGASLIDPRLGFAGFSMRGYQLDYGVPGGFVGAHPLGVDIEMEKRQYNLRARRHSQSGLLDNLSLQLSRSYYRHKEFESGGVVGSEFRITGYNGRLDAEHREFGIADHGTLGISFEHRDFNIGGYVFTPPAQSINVSTYLYERAEVSNLSWEVALRVGFDQVKPRREFGSEIGAIRRREFTSISASGSLLYSWTPSLHAGANLSRSNRVPTIEELYSQGPHLAAYSYEIGNPDLNSERGIGIETFAYFKSDGRYFMFSAFRNELSYYIIPRNTGAINYQTFLPVYATEGVGATFLGLESLAEWDFSARIRAVASLSYTRGRLDESGSPLPQIPPLKGLVELRYATPHWSVGVNAQLAAPQHRVDTFEAPTVGYVLANFFAQWSRATGTVVHGLSANLDNAFDQEYRNHLSRVKSILPEAGRNLRVAYKLILEF